MITNPPLARDHFREAEKLFQSRHYLNALISFRQAYDLDPCCGPAMVHAGECCVQLNSFFLALEYFQEALVTKPDAEMAWRGAGQCYFQLGRVSLAIECFEKGLALHPGHAMLIEDMKLAGHAKPMIEAYFARHVPPSDPFVRMLRRSRFKHWLDDFRNAAKPFWPRILAWYRECLRPDYLHGLKSEWIALRNGAQVPGMTPENAPPPEVREAFLQQIGQAIHTIERVIGLGRSAGFPRVYRFGGADGARSPSAGDLADALQERKQLIADLRSAPEQADVTRLRIRGIKWMQGILRALPGDSPAVRAAADLPRRIAQAIASRNYELAQARAFAEHELMMSFAEEGLAESETYPSGEGESEGNTDFDIAAAAKAVRDAADPQQARHLVEQAGWHAESILHAMFMLGPSMYVLFAADYKQAYDLGHKLVAISELVPEKLKRFPLRAFYRLQYLAPLQEAAAKRGLHEETIDLGGRILATVRAMGAEWQLDLPKWPGMALRLQMADLPERLAVRACDLTAQSYRQLGDEANATAYWEKKEYVVSELRGSSDKFGARDARALLEEIRRSDELDGAFKYGHLALALDERKYRDASLRFSVNRHLAQMAGDLGLRRMRLVYGLRAFTAAVEMNIPFNVLYCYHELGLALEQQEEKAGAEYFYRKALTQIDADRMKAGATMVTTRAAIATLFRLALLIMAQNPREAEQLLLRAIGVIENQREMIEQDLNAAGFGQAGSQIYAALIDLTLEPPADFRRAFEILERSKMRALLDQFAKRSDDAEKKTWLPASLEQVQEVLRSS